jgi:hypothetical protein
VGTWTRSGKAQDVILERPHAADSASMNDLLGDWEGMSDPAHLYLASTRLHIYQSRDGALCAWMDRINAPSDQRHGELLQVAASENRGIILTTTAPTGMTCRFRGALSVDGSAQRNPARTHLPTPALAPGGDPHGAGSAPHTKPRQLTVSVSPGASARLGRPG